MIKDIQIQKQLLCVAIMLCLVQGSQFNEAILISNLDPMEKTEIENISYPIQFEFWSFSIPNQKVTSFPWIEQQLDIDIHKQQLLMLIKNSENNKVFLFMYVNVITMDYVIHNLYVDNEIVNIVYDPSEYEGIWILNLITLNEKTILFKASGSIREIQFEFQLNQNFNKLQFYIGGSGIINRYELGIFRGRLSKLFIHYREENFKDIYFQRIQQLRMNEYEYKIGLIPDTIIFDGILQKAFEFDQFGQKFTIFGWAKYFTYNAYSLKLYLLLRLTIFFNYQDETNIGDEVLKVIANLDLSDSNNCGYDITSHHYWMPYPLYVSLEASNDRIKLKNDLPYLQILSQWHFISFEYGISGEIQKTQFVLSFFENNKLISKTYYLGDSQYKNLFINTKFYAIFGGDYTVYEKTLGQVSGFYFISNYLNNQNIYYTCHYSCLTCNGPLKTNCLSCYDNNERVFLQQQHQCVCKLGQIEKNEKCQFFFDLFKTLSLVEIQFEQKSSQCQFGYFYLPLIQKCIKCPQWNSYNLYCVDCILDSINWYKRPICKTDFITQQITQDQDAYTQQLRSTLDYDVYYIDNNYNLILLDGIYDFCDITQIQIENCNELGVQHLQSITFGLCKQNLYFANRTCILLDSACLHVNQNKQTCLECQRGYYLSEDQKSCSLCPKYCQICQSLKDCLNCEIGFGLINGQCQRCGNFCKTCKYSKTYNLMQCQSCIDNELYFLSLNAKDCKRNEIQNCIYAFETSTWDYTINSLDYDFKPYEDQTTTQCAKCKDGYYFILMDYYKDQQYCLEGLSYPCQQFFERLGGVLFNQICLFGLYQERSIVYSFADQCARMKLHCVHCLIEQLSFKVEKEEIIPDKVTYICLVCENGYYAEKKTGQCQSCPTDLNCLSCFQQNKFTKDNWKIATRAYYRAVIETEYNLHKFTQFGLSQVDSDYEILCTVCQQGYEFHGDKCIQICPESCLECVLQNSKNICVKCPLGLNGRNRSLINNQCISCPTSCDLCIQRDDQDVLLINPFFNRNSEFYFYSYQCISGFKGIFDQDLGIYIDCENGPCQKQIVINLNLICNVNEYQQQIDQLTTDEEKTQFRESNILSDHLFSSQSFFQFENYEFYYLANQQSIKKILIKIYSNKNQKCLVNDQLKVQQKFSTNIFSAINVELEIYGNKITTFKFEKQLLFSNFSRIHIEGIQLEVEYFNFGPNLLKFSSLFEQTIELVDITYEQNFNLTTFYTLMENAKNVRIQNFLVKNCTRQFQIDSFIKIQQIKSLQTIKINNFTIINSSFSNLKLLWFDLKVNDQVEIQNLNIESTYFNLALLYQPNGLLKLNQIRIYSCQISSLNGLFEINSLQNVELISLDFIQNQIYAGSIVNLNQQIKMMKLNFVENQLYNNSLIISNIKSTMEYIFIEEILFELNYYNQNAAFIKITTNLLSNKYMIINQLSMIGNKLLSIPLQSTFNIINEALIYLEIDTIKIEQLVIQKAYGIHEFVVINANELKLNQIRIQKHNNQISKRLYQSLDCFQKFLVNHYDSVYMKIIDVPRIDIKYLFIQKAESINNPVIEIKTSILKSQTKKLIFMSEMHFNQNLLLTTNKLRLSSIMKISTEEDYDIEIKNSIFERNIMHQYIYIDQINSGLVFYFDCKNCTILLNNLSMKGNIVTNSSNSIIYIQTKSIELTNSKFIQNSLFDYSILQPYLYWGYQKGQNIFIEQIIEKFPIKVKTGNGKIVCQSIMMKHIQIYNSTSSAFQIYLEKEASLQVQNLNVQFINALFQNEDENGGAFLIDTSISLSTLISFVNTFARNINFRNKGGFLYLQNPLESTIIQLQNLVIKDVYSLKGSLFYVQFTSHSNTKQQLILENLELKNSYEGYLRFISKFNQINSQLLSELKLERSLIEITYSNFISLRNLQIESLFYEALVICQESLIIEIINCKIFNSSLQNSLIQLNLMQSNSLIRIVELQVSTLELLDHISNRNNCTSIQTKIEELQQICSNDLSIQDSPELIISEFVQDHLYNSYCIINKINDEKHSITGLIYINSDATQIQISQLNLQNINCKICQQGLVDISIYDQQTRITMNSIVFLDNQCGQQSCMNIMKTIQTSRILQSLNQYINEQNYELKLSNYKCIGNHAYQGTCLQIQNITTLIVNSLLQNNTAESWGGSIYVIGHQSFFVLNTVIQFNQALYGGGLFLKDQIIQNLIQQGTLINDNKGTLFGDNFAQLPSQLSVSIDLQHILPKIKILEKENILIEEIQIPKYQLFFNSYSGSLYVPNGQNMSLYKYFDWHKQEYIDYNLHLRLYALDQYNNIQENLDGTKCSISGRVLSDEEDSDFNQDFMSIKEVSFLKSDYNFDNIIFYLDNQLNITLQLQFHCDSIFTPIYGKNQEILGYHNNYFLRMNIKSLPCQLGEIVYDGICLLCNATQGLYSLVVNSNNCSQKDDFSTSEIKSAQIKLKPGFWRPYFDTNFINQCINLLDNCNGGWIEGDTSCFKGHIGALCEECDIYNSQGFGHFSINSKYSCGLCVENIQNLVAIIAISFWTFISILISVRSNVSLNDQIVIKKVISKLILSKIEYHSNFGILIKMLTHHLQIVSAIFTFKISTIIGFGQVVNSISYPIQTMTHSLDCFLKDLFDFQIHYSVIVWQLIMPFIYIGLFLLFYWIILKIYKKNYSISVLTTTLIYMYIYLQPSLVFGLISLISYRSISGFNWIQANVAYRYDTLVHQLWLFRFILPLLLFIAVIIPFFFLVSLYLNKNKLIEKRTRLKWGYLYNEYKLEAYFWEIIKILFKELMIIFLSYYDENIVKKGILLLSLVYIYWQLSLKYRPYQSFILNNLDSYSANVSGISITVAIGIYIDQQSETQDISIPYLIILLTLNLQYLARIFYELISSFIEENVLFFDKIKDHIVINYPKILKYQIIKKLLVNRNIQKHRIQLRYFKLKKYLIGKARYLILCKKNYGVKLNSTLKSSHQSYLI